MGITSQRLHRRKVAEARGQSAAPAVASLPPLISREHHQRAIADARRGYVPRSELDQANAELTALREHVAEIEASNAKLSEQLVPRSELDQASADGGSGGGEQPAADAPTESPASSEEPKPEEPKGKGGKKGK